MKTIRCPYCHGQGRVEFTLGTMVLSARKAKGMTQGALAERAGVCRAQIANIESDRSGTSARTLVRLAQALGVPAGSLLP